MINIIQFNFESNGHIKLHLEDGKLLWLRQTSDFGQVIWRYKINTITRVKHPGIIIGEELVSKRKFVIHNHYAFQGAAIDTLSEFTKGQIFFYRQDVCVNSPKEVVANGLTSVINKETYHWLTNNCQHFANKACHNVPKSEDVSKWVWIGLGLLSFVGGVWVYRKIKK